MPYIDRRPGIRPRPSFGRRLDIIARVSFPGCITILLMFLTAAPWGIAGQAALLPAIALCCVWFWSLFRPENFGPPVVFAVGLLMDLLGYLPLGAGVFTLLSVHALALNLRRGLAHRGFAWLWVVFAVVAAAASLVIWLLVMLLNFRLMSPRPAIFTAVLSAAIYPILAVPFAAAHLSAASPEDA